MVQHTQYHPRYQWINTAAIEYHIELAKGPGVMDEEKLDALRSDIWAGLSDYYKFLTVTKQTFGAFNQEDIVSSLLIRTMEHSNKKGDPGWLDSFSLSEGVPFLGYIAKLAPGAIEHLKRSENAGSGRTQDEIRRFNKKLAERREEHPDEDLDTAKINVFNALGIGIEQIRNVEAISAVHIVSTEHPIGDGITLGDTLHADSEGKGLSTIDRTTLQLRQDRLPIRYQRVLESILDGGIEGIHDIKFGEPLSLAEKVVVFSTTMKAVREHTSHQR
jgi:hypothetical protein